MTSTLLSDAFISAIAAEEAVGSGLAKRAGHQAAKNLFCPNDCMMTSQTSTIQNAGLENQALCADTKRQLR